MSCFAAAFFACCATTFHLAGAFVNPSTTMVWFGWLHHWFQHHHSSSCEHIIWFATPPLPVADCQCHCFLPHRNDLSHLVHLLSAAWPLINFDWPNFYCQPASLHSTRPLLLASPPLFDSVSIIVVCHVAISHSAGILVALLPLLHVAYRVISSCTVSYWLDGTFIICCAPIYIIWLPYSQLPSWCCLLLPPFLFIVVLPFLILLVHFLIAVPSHLLLVDTIVGCPFTTSSLVWPIW